MRTLLFTSDTVNIAVKIDRIAAIDKTSAGDITVMEVEDRLVDGDPSEAPYKDLIKQLPSTIHAQKQFAMDHGLELAVEAAEVGDSDVRISGTLTKPATLTFGATTTTSIVTNWTSGDTDGVTYTLEVGEESDFSDAEVVYTGPLLTKTVTGLTIDTTYYFRVKVSAPGFTDSDWKTGTHDTAAA